MENKLESQEEHFDSQDIKGIFESDDTDQKLAQAAQEIEEDEKLEEIIGELEDDYEEEEKLDDLID